MTPTPRPHNTLRSALAALALTASLTLTGCNLGEDVSFDGYPVSEITTEEADPIYRELLADIQHIVTTTGGTAPFQDADRSTGACLDGGKHESFGYDAFNDDPIPEDRWPEVLDEVTALLEADGFDEVNVRADEPGKHNVAFRKPDGTVVILGTQVASSVSITTACHPVPDAGEDT